MAQAIFEPTFSFSWINTLTIPKHRYSSYEDGTKCSETSAYKIQTPVNYPEENIKYIILLFRENIALCKGSNVLHISKICEKYRLFILKLVINIDAIVLSKGKVA
jgi:hypothetical protein